MRREEEREGNEYVGSRKRKGRGRISREVQEWSLSLSLVELLILIVVVLIRGTRAGEQEEQQHTPSVRRLVRA